MMMFPGVMSRSVSVSDDASPSSGPRVRDFGPPMNPMLHNSFSVHQDPQNKAKKRRNLPGNPHPDSEVVALSPRTLMATNRFVCEICNKGFQRDQNLQLHRRGHNLPWKLKQRSNKEVIRKRVYICPEVTCVHNHPSRALGDLTGIKKHFCRKHGEKKWKCDKCSKVYAVESDWKAHRKTCGTKEYRCDCGTLFTRKDSFITHRAFCDALAEESARLSVAATSNSILSPPNPNTTPSHTPTHPNPNAITNNSFFHSLLTSSPPPPPPSFFPFSSLHRDYPNTWEPLLLNPHNSPARDEEPYIPHLSLYQNTPPTNHMTLPPFGHYGMDNPIPPPLSATALLQKAASIGAAVGQAGSSSMAPIDMLPWAHKRMGAAVGQVGSSSSMAQMDMRSWAHQSMGAAMSQAGSSSMPQMGMQPWTNNNTSDGFTRDFLGLANHSSRGGGGGGSSSGVGGSGSGSVREMMPFEFNSYDHDQHIPKFRYSNHAWENC